MHVSKNQIPAKVDVPGIVARQAAEFGDASGLGKMTGEYFTLAAGTNLAPLAKGLKGDACPVPHWGYVLSGELVVTYTDGKTETCKESDLFYWPPGHNVRVAKEAEVILFSPQAEHARSMEHMTKAMKA